LDFAAEALDVDPGRQLREKDLHHHFAAERALVGKEDPRHPTPAKLALKEMGISQRPLHLVLKRGGHVIIGRSLQI
jgi:hypothetical protein